MPIGIPDTCVDGLESYVLVSSPQADQVAACFGRVVPWWPADPSIQAQYPWLLSPVHEESWTEARKRIRAFAAREADLSCVLVQSGASHALPWSEDDDYHTPMFEDALAAMQHATPAGPELYESPVRVAARLSGELSTSVAALWGSDELAGLEGLSLWDRGKMLWSASTYAVDEIQLAFSAYSTGDEADLSGADRYEAFYLLERGSDAVRIDQPLVEWADAKMRALGLGLDIALSPHSLHPFDLVRHNGMGLAEFVVAVPHGD